MKKNPDLDAHTSIQALKDRVKNFCEARNWDRFHNAKDLAIGIITESSELLEHFRFKNEAEVAVLFRKNRSRQAICEELVDILHTILRFAQKHQIDLTTELSKKMRKNERKYPVKRKIK